MELGLAATVTLLVAAAALFWFARGRAKAKADPLRVRMVNYTHVQFLSLLVVLLMLSHVLTLIFGHPVTGMRN